MVLVHGLSDDKKERLAAISREQSKARERAKGKACSEDHYDEEDESDSSSGTSMEEGSDNEDDQALSAKRKGGPTAKQAGKKAKWAPTKFDPCLSGPSPPEWNNVEFKLEPVGNNVGQRYLLHHSMFRPANFEAVKRHVAGQNMSVPPARRQAFDSATETALRTLEDRGSPRVPSGV